MQDRLKLKASLDILNSLEVQRDLVHVRSRRSITGKLLARWTGKSEREIDAVQSHVLIGFDGLHRIISGIQEDIGESDIILAKAITKLREIDQSFSQSTQAIAEISEQIVRLESRLIKLEHRVEDLEAQGSIQFFISELNAAIEEGTLDVAMLIDRLDEMWWGEFGISCRRASQKGERLFSLFMREFKAALRGKGSEGFIDVRSLIEAVPLAPENVHEELELLAFAPTWTLRPITSAVLDRRVGRDGKSSQPQFLPIALPPDRLCERIMEETQRGTAE